METKEVLEKIKPFIALSILVFIIVSTIFLIKFVNLQEEIKDNCGYSSKEKVYCICDKNLVSQIYTENNPYYQEVDFNKQWD